MSNNSNDLKEMLEAAENLPATGEIPVVDGKDSKTQTVDSANSMPVNNNTESKSVDKTKSYTAPIIAGVIVILIIIGLVIAFGVRKPSSFSGLFAGEFRGEGVETTGFFNARTVDEVNNGKTQSSFKSGDPIIAKFTLKVPDTDETQTYTYQVKNIDKKGETLRQGSITVAKNGDEKTVDRYIAVVSSARTALEAGKYSIGLLLGEKEVSKNIITVTK